MVLFSRYHKKCKVAYLRIGLIAIALSALFMPTFEPVKSVGNNIFTLFLNGNEIGRFESEEDADKLLNEARRIVAGDSEEVVMIEAATEIVGEEVLVSKTDNEDEMLVKIVDEYRNSIKETLQHSYTVKIDDYMVNVSSSEAVVELLEASIDKYAEPDAFSVSLASDSSREIPVFVPVVTKNETEEAKAVTETASDILTDDGFYGAFDSVFDNVTQTDEEKSFEDFDYGITDISFSDDVEIVESYLPSSQISSTEDAIDEVTKDKEEKTIYEVVSGDTLSRIADKTGISIDNLISLNSESLSSANSIIRVGDELTITVPEPELSVNREELVYYEGTYEADVIYQYNDSWYTTTEVVLQEPSSGYHKAVEKVTYYNGDVVSTEVVKEEVVAEAIPKIVEKGTKIPPTYIKPISGGTLTSGFGGRTATIRGMTSYHVAVDWGTPVGTSVVASCGGTVTQAGWLGTYGYVIFIKHPDGKETRYAHLKTILVSKGDYVSQGQKIALSGNTGASTGPHLHFEMRINGVAVNPLNYLSY